MLQSCHYVSPKVFFKNSVDSAAQRFTRGPRKLESTERGIKESNKEGARRWGKVSTALVQTLNSLDSQSSTFSWHPPCVCKCFCPLSPALSVRHVFRSRVLAACSEICPIRRISEIIIAWAAQHPLLCFLPSWQFTLIPVYLIYPSIPLTVPIYPPLALLNTASSVVPPFIITSASCFLVHSTALCTDCHHFADPRYTPSALILSPFLHYLSSCRSRALPHSLSCPFPSF